MGTPKISVIVVNYNTTELAAEALRSLRDRLGRDRIEVIVVDNASRAFDAGPLVEAWPEVQVVESPENLGFGRANNRGAQHARGEYLWLLNADTLVPADHELWSLVGFLDSHPTYAAASPLLTDECGTVQPWQTGYFPAVWRMLLSPPARLLARLAPPLHDHLGLVDTNLRRQRAADVDQVVAAAVMVRRSAFDAVGGFSPEYFFFLEDTDLCRKWREGGWKIRWLPESHVIHLWGTSVRDPIARQRMFFAAQDRYLRRWHSPATLVLVRALRLPLMASVRLRDLGSRRAAESH